MKYLKPNYKVTGAFFENRKILKFRNHYELISDDDIINLFMGLVRLIKKSTEMKVEARYLKEIESLKNSLQRL